MKQITILSEGEKDLIAEITQMLADAGVSIDTITGRNYNEHAIVTVTVDNYDEAMKTMTKHKDLKVMGEDALIVRIEDELGALAKLSRRFTDAGIHIRSIRFVKRSKGHALVAISTERTNKALELVKDILVS